jgi:hypothetical protein
VLITKSGSRVTLPCLRDEPDAGKLLTRLTDIIDGTFGV